MKKILYTGVMALGIAMMTSCSDIDTDLDTIVPPQYDRILSLKDAGVREISMSVADRPYVYDLSILKGGIHNEFAAETMLEVLTQSDIDAGYNDILGTRYKVLSAGMYTITDYHRTIGAGETGRSVKVTFDAPRIYSATLADNAGSTFVLPIRLTSSTDSVNVSNNEVLLSCSVAPGRVSMAELRNRVQLLTDGETFTLKFKVEKEGAVTAGLRFSVKDQAAVDELYSGPEGIDYMVIPAECYRMEPTATMEAGDEVYEHPVEMDVEAVRQLADANPKAVFVMPLTLESTTADVVTGNPDMLVICGFHSYESVEIYDKSAFSIAYGTLSMPYGRYESMFDGVENEQGWMSYLNDGFAGSQGLGAPYVVIDMGASSIFSEFGIYIGDAISGGYWDTHPLGVEFYVTEEMDLDPKLTDRERDILDSKADFRDVMPQEYLDLHERLRQFDASVNWVRVAQGGPWECSGAAVGRYWCPVSSSLLDSRLRSRYVKMVVQPQLPGGIGGDRSKIHEFYVKRLTKIDGEAVN